jgi:hypothetical protein
MVQVPQAAAAGLAVDEYDYDLFPLGTTGVGTSPVAVSNTVPDGYTLKIARLTLTNTGAAGKLTLQIVSQATGVVTPYGGLGTQPIFTYYLGGSTSVELSEDQLELTVPAGFQLQAFLVGATADVVMQGRYLRGGFV